MFPGGPRRPMPPYPPVRPRRPIQGTPKPGLLSHFQDREGNLDIEKISQTAKQVSEIYSQVSPMVTKFMKK
ncbi:YppG family protein [Virgibacillus doumboii]|uniref:YppG family protein n=1 Tax=Virgibacillus doumboii TaxID=2697503 RepID=UPI001FEC52FA|nr:YppG family protein [Virgibacillus doumboii]